MSEDNKTPSKYSVACDLYDRIRDHVKTENDLYNQRVIWLITMQAILFATVGLVVLAKISDVSGVFGLFLLSIFIIISLTGAMTAVICNKKLNEAREVLNYMGKKWEEYTEGEDFKELDIDELFPQVKGRDDSGDKQPHWLFRSGNLPTIFAWSWFLFAGVAVIEFIT